ncbi:MAG TPA: NUDIX hydrolase [Bacteroidales bacterium]|nr:NUDIX hydrolase [Bacteroidales bacterium]HRX98417.1 NUDIX hydrolase [Bacteroidales bacterium]
MNSPQKLPFNEFVKIYSKVPRLCVDLLINNDDGFLLTLRAIEPGKGQWHFPGGTVLMGESIEDAIVRIAKEETSLEVDNPQHIGILEFNEHENPFFHTISLVFEVDIISGTPKGSEQGKQFQFFEDPPENMIEEQKIFMEDFL